MAAGSDDAEEAIATGNVSLNSSDLELILDHEDQIVGMRFAGLAIPPGASIVDAWIQFQVDETDSVATALTIRGQRIANAPTFTSSTGNVSSRTPTGAFASWAPPAWTQVGAAGADQRTPSLAGIVSEIVGLPGWASGNALVFLVTGSGTRTAESYNGDSAGAPLLHVEFSTQANDPPSVQITAPADGASFAQGQTIAFGGSASDPEDGNLTASLAWTSSLDGPVGTGGSFTRSDLSPGTHTITASVTDSGGKSASQQVQITVVSSNTPPQVTLTAPADGASFAQGQTIAFGGSGSDSQDGNLTASLAWTSSLDGPIGTGGSFSRSDLSPGTHTITASVTDSGGLSASQQVQISVVPPSNTPPTVQITAPANDSVVSASSLVTLSATALDAEDGNLGGSVTWTSSKEGTLGTGASISVRFGSYGKHTITATVTDSGGAQAADSISVRVSH